MGAGEWLFTRGGQDFAESIKRIGRGLEALVDTLKKDSEPDMATEEEVHQGMVDDVALELFKKEFTSMHIVFPANRERTDLFDTMVRQCYFAAERFVKIRQEVLEEIDERPPGRDH